MKLKRLLPELKRNATTAEITAALQEDKRNIIPLSELPYPDPEDIEKCLQEEKETDHLFQTGYKRIVENLLILNPDTHADYPGLDENLWNVNLDALHRSLANNKYRIYLKKAYRLLILFPQRRNEIPHDDAILNAITSYLNEELKLIDQNPNSNIALKYMQAKMIFPEMQIDPDAKTRMFEWGIGYLGRKKDDPAALLRTASCLRLLLPERWHEIWRADYQEQVTTHTSSFKRSDDPEDVEKQLRDKARYALVTANEVELTPAGPRFHFDKPLQQAPPLPDRDLAAA